MSENSQQNKSRGEIQREFQSDFVGQKRREFLANSAKFLGFAAVGFSPLFANAFAANSSVNSQKNSQNSAISKGTILVQNLHKTPTAAQSKNIFLYYSRSLNTHILASYAQSLVGGALWRAQTAQPYPQDYQAMVERARAQRVGGELPQLLAKPDIKGFENVIIAAPLWGMDICAPMKSALASLDLRGKRLFLIVTNAGFGLGASVKSVQKYAKIGRLAGVLDYKFENYEKIVPNLLAINQRQIAENRAFDMLDKDKIHTFLGKI